MAPPAQPSAPITGTGLENKRIVLATLGLLGDLHPYFAIGLALEARGHEAVLATYECYRRKIERAGLGFQAVRPDCDWVSGPVATGRQGGRGWVCGRV